jgi:dTDP-glucose 4,6-dehydratase
MGLSRLRDINAVNNPRVRIFTTDIRTEISDGIVREIAKDITHIAHLAAETHVDKSIKDPKLFVETNVIGTFNVLEFAKKCPNLEAFNYFSTDEVYGPAPDGILFKESDGLNCTNPYSASKAGGQELASSYANTYSMPLFISNCMNVFGERQHPEKFVIKCIDKVLRGETVYIHANNDYHIGTRNYIHARNVAKAIEFLFQNFNVNERYNINGEKEVNNLEMLNFIASIIGKEPKHEIINFVEDRPGHDFRYALDGTKMEQMGWFIPMTFEQSLMKTVQWTLAHKE